MAGVYIQAVIILVAWISVMGLLAGGAGWVIFSRFPEVFFDSDNWRATRKGRVSRAVVLGLVGVFGLVLLACIVALAALGINTD